MADHARVFISYSSKDSDLVAQLKRDLAAAGIVVWLDHEQLRPDTLDWQEAVRRGITQATHVIYAASPDAARSQYVIHEITMARGERKPVFAFWIRGDDEKWYDSTPMGWILAQYTDARGPSYQAGIGKLLSTLVGAANPQQANPGGGSSNQIDWSEFDRRMEGMRASSRDIPDLPARLAQLGFRGVNVRGAPAIIPPMVSVAAGPFLMGSDKAQDKDAHENETPQRYIEVAAFQIGKYPVTVAEYALAVRADAVREPQAEIRDYGDFSKLFALMLDENKRRKAAPPFETTTISWANQSTHPDHPVIGVSWHDAMAYITWLRNVTERPEWRLPTEAEWEKAARWDAARGVSLIYPWGDTFDKTRCNSEESGATGTNPVGSHPASNPQISGASPYGVEDMAGNVTEWTSSLTGDTRSMRCRGGSWSASARGVRSAALDGRLSTARTDIGFRLARSGT